MLESMKPHVVIAGGGFAALEALIAIRRLAGARVDLTLVTPSRELAYRPLSVVEPFGLGEAPRFDLGEIARDHDAELQIDTAAAVEGKRKVLVTRSGRERAYDWLLVTTGAEPVEAVNGSLTYRGAPDRAAFEDLLRAIEAGDVAKVVFAVPAGTAWSLPAYELALMTASHTARLESPPRLAIVTLEATPLALFGRDPSEAVRGLLQDQGIEFHGATHPVAFRDGSLSVVPQGTIAADRVVALPQLRGNAPAGLPTDNEGFVPVDVTGRVRGEDRVYAAGDVTAFPIKQGGIAAQQADAAAAAIAAEAGAPVTAEEFRPVLRGLLLTGTGARFFRTEVSGGDGDASEVSRRLLWWPEMKVAGRHLSHYLSREVEPMRLADPLPPDAIPVELDLSGTAARERDVPRADSSPAAVRPAPR
jgi:sulfide:quinone oxidoreductase